jgi:hypothetical protein
MTATTEIPAPQETKHDRPRARRPRRRLSVFDRAVIVLLAAGLAFVYIGFFFPDPRLANVVRSFLDAVRIAFPLVALIILLLYAGLRTRRVRFTALILAVIGLVSALLIVYPVAANVYYRSFNKKLGDYHPYLQLAPPEFKPQTAPPGERPFRIFCVGGSTTEFRDGRGLGWPDRVQTLLQGAVAGRPVEVYNLGRQWYTSLHILINYAANLRPLKPDVLVVMEAVNDLLHNADFCYYSFGPFREDYGHFQGPVYRLIRRPTLEDTVLQVLRSMWYYPSRAVVDASSFPGLVPFERNLRSLIDLARADGVRLVLMTQPSLFKETMSAEEDAALVMIHVEAVGPTKQWSTATGRRGMERYNDVIRRVAIDQGVTLIDLDTTIPKSLDYFQDDVHYKAPGFDLVASTVAMQLRASGLLGPRNGD